MKLKLFLSIFFMTAINQQSLAEGRTDNGGEDLAAKFIAAGYEILDYISKESSENSGVRLSKEELTQLYKTIKETTVDPVDKLIYDDDHGGEVDARVVKRNGRWIIELQKDEWLNPEDGNFLGRPQRTVLHEYLRAASKNQKFSISLNDRNNRISSRLNTKAFEAGKYFDLAVDLNNYAGLVCNGNDFNAYPNKRYRYCKMNQAKTNFCYRGSPAAIIAMAESKSLAWDSKEYFSRADYSSNKSEELELTYENLRDASTNKHITVGPCGKTVSYSCKLKSKDSTILVTKNFKVSFFGKSYPEITRQSISVTTLANEKNLDLSIYSLKPIAIEDFDPQKGFSLFFDDGAVTYDWVFTFNKGSNRFQVSLLFDGDIDPVSAQYTCEQS